MVGITEDRRLVFFWKCKQCFEEVQFVKSLADLWREVTFKEPPTDTKQLPLFDDAGWLHRLGISFPPQPDTEAH